VHQEAFSGKREQKPRDLRMVWVGRDPDARSAVRRQP